MATASQIIDKLLKFEKVTDTARNQLNAEIKKSSGSSYGIIRDRVLESLEGQATPAVVEAITAVTYIFDPHSPPDIAGLKTEVAAYYESFTGEQFSALSSSSPEHGQITNSLQNMSSHYPERSPIRLLLQASTPAVSARIISDPVSAVQDLSESLSHHSTSSAAKTELALSEIVPDIASVHPQISDLYSATKTLFTDQVPAVNPSAAASQTVLYKLLSPSASPTTISSFISQHIPIQPDISEVSLISFSQLVSGFKITAAENTDFALNQSLNTYLIEIGISPDAAEKLAPKLADSLKPAYYLVGFSDIPDTASIDPGTHQEIEIEAFSEISQSGLENFEVTNKQAGNIPPQKQLNLSPRKIYEKFQRRYKSPQNINPEKEFGKSDHDSHLIDYLKYISDQPERWVKNKTTAALNNFLVQSKLGQKISKSELGKKLISHIEKSLKTSDTVVRAPLTNIKTFNYWFENLSYTKLGKEIVNKAISPFKPALSRAYSSIAHSSLGKAASSTVSKLAATTAGKAVTAATTKIATNATLQAILQPIASIAPGIGNAIAWVVGFIASEIVAKFVSWLTVQYQKYKEYIQALFVGAITAVAGGLMGLGTAATALVAGTVVVAAHGSITGSLGLWLGRFFSPFPTVFKIFIAPIFFAVIATSLTFLFVFFIIYNSAYVVPYSLDNLTIDVTPAPGTDPPGEINEPLPDPYPGFIPGGGGVAPPIGGTSCASGCPIAGGRITNGSYNPLTEETGGHGSNWYWDGFTSPCGFSLPQSISCMAPGVSANICTQLGLAACSYYGRAIDVFAPVVDYPSPVYLPLLDGQFVNWSYHSSFANPCSEGVPYGTCVGWTARYTSGSSRIVFTHINSNFSQGASLPSGTEVATLFDQGGNTHLHLEFYHEGEWKRPEEYFCGSGGGGCVPLNTCLSPNFCAPNGACLAEGGDPGERLDCGDFEICCEMPVEMTRCESPNFCALHGACLGDGGTPGPSLDCGGTNICCFVE